MEARVVEVALAVSLPGVAADTMAAAMTAVEVMAVSERAAVGLVVAAAVEIHLVVQVVAATAAAEAPAAVVGWAHSDCRNQSNRCRGCIVRKGCQGRRRRIRRLSSNSTCRCSKEVAMVAAARLAAVA